MEDIEELEDGNCEVEPVTRFDLYWTCKECGCKDNVEYNIPIEKTIECVCEKCGKKYLYNYCPY